MWVKGSVWSSVTGLCSLPQTQERGPNCNGLKNDKVIPVSAAGVDRAYLHLKPGFGCIREALVVGLGSGGEKREGNRGGGSNFNGELCVCHGPETSPTQRSTGALAPPSGGR